MLLLSHCYPSNIVEMDAMGMCLLDMLCIEKMFYSSVGVSVEIFGIVLVFDLHISYY